MTTKILINYPPRDLLDVTPEDLETFESILSWVGITYEHLLLAYSCEFGIGSVRVCEPNEVCDWLYSYINWYEEELKMLCTGETVDDPDAMSSARDYLYNISELIMDNGFDDGIWHLSQVLMRLDLNLFLPPILSLSDLVILDADTTGHTTEIIVGGDYGYMIKDFYQNEITDTLSQ